MISFSAGFIVTLAEVGALPGSASGPPNNSAPGFCETYSDVNHRRALAADDKLGSSSGSTTWAATAATYSKVVRPAPGSTIFRQNEDTSGGISRRSRVGRTSVSA